MVVVGMQSISFIINEADEKVYIQFKHGFSKSRWLSQSVMNEEKSKLSLNSAAYFDGHSW